MSTFCKGEHCPVKKQCQKYIDYQLNPVFEGEKEIRSCRNQRQFVKADEEYYKGISKQTADDLAKAFADFGKSIAPLAENLNKFATNILVDHYLKLTRQFMEAKYKSLTKSIFTRWWWKRKADKLSEQVDKLGELIDQHIEKGGDQ